MKILKTKNFTAFIVLIVALCTLPGCLTAKKLDKFVARQYNNELPKPGKKRKAEIEVNPAPPAKFNSVSMTVHKTDKFLPLLFYWKLDHRQKCSLNPAIPGTNFSNALNSTASKKLTDKLNGRKLELTVEQTPADFSIVLKENMVWLIYAYSWSRIYIEPDTKDLVVSYKVLDAENAVKTGRITVKNTDKNKGLRFFQSWKSATSEYLSQYDANLAAMTKSFIAQLAEEL